MKLIDKDYLIQYLTGMADAECCDDNTERIIKKYIIPHINALEAKEIDLNALGILAEHLLACEAHAVSPKYRDEELDLLEKLKNNKAQKGKEV